MRQELCSALNEYSMIKARFMLSCQLTAFFNEILQANNGA